jgi:phage terminase small subunit
MSDSEKPKRERKLTPKQERFCQYYSTHFNATRAAREAGFGNKPESHSRYGHELLKNSQVSSRIAELSERTLKDLGFSRERVIQGYTRLAFYDMSDAYDEIGQLRPVKEMPDDIRDAVVKVKVFEHAVPSGGEDGDDGGKTVVGFTKEIEFAQRKSALDSLTKILGIAPEQLELSGRDGKPIETKDVTELTDEQRQARIAALLAKRATKNG